MKSVSLVTVGLLSLCLGACSTVGGASNTQSQATAFGAPVMSRTIPERIHDESIEFTARKNLSSIQGVSENSVRIAIDSFRGEVLLTGEVPTQAIKNDVQNMVSSMRDVKSVYNYLKVVSTPKSQSHTTHENYLRLKIVARLLPNRDIKNSQYKLIVRDQTAYLMGYLTPSQQGHVIDAIQATAGMEAAVTLTTLVNAEGVSLSQDNIMNEATEAQESVVYGGVVPNQAPTMTVPAMNAPLATGVQDPYVLQQVQTPNATTQAPSNTAPIYAPVATPSTSSYIQLYQGTNNP